MTHPELVKALRKPALQVLSDFVAAPDKLQLVNAVFSVSTAANSLLEASHVKGVRSTNLLTCNDVDCIHMLLGICGEAGELLDAVKKYALYNKPLDIANMREELGDLCFYFEGFHQVMPLSMRNWQTRACVDVLTAALLTLCKLLNLTLEDVKQGNIDKLTVRYSKGVYSNEQAIARADKLAGETVSSGVQ